MRRVLQWRLTGWVVVGLGSVCGALLLTAVCHAPENHDIHTPGAIAIQFGYSEGWPERYFSGTIRPSQSLADIRCQAWQATNGKACPDDATLERTYWPKLKQSPATLYLGFPSTCGQDYLGAFNVEYLATSRTLLIHCHVAAPWIVIPVRICCPGLQPVPHNFLVLVETNSIPPGKVRIVRDERIEHHLGDQSTESLLATVTIS